MAHCIHLNQLTLQLPKQTEQYPTEFSLISNVRSVTVQAETEQERDQWIEAIHNAKKNYEENMKTFGGMRPKSEIVGLGDIAPIWIPDYKVSACQVIILLIHPKVGDPILNPRSATWFLGSEGDATIAEAAGKSSAACAPGTRLLSNTSTTRKDGSATSAIWNYSKVSHLVNNLCFKVLFVGYVNKPEMKRMEERSQIVGREASQKQNVPNRFIEASMKQAEDKHEASGFLTWKGAKDRASKKNWCVLMDRIIYFYKAEEDVAAVETMPVLGWKLSQVR